MREARWARLVRAWRSLSIIVALGACKDATAPKQPHVSRALVSPALTDAEPSPPMGIGGSVTISASGSFLPDVPRRAYGLTLPPSIPVRVAAAGHVPRPETAGRTFLSSL